MFSKVLLAVLFTTAVVAGQRGGGGQDQGGGDTMSARALTPFEEFAGKLKLDVKTQGAAVEAIFAEGAKEAEPVGREIMVLRQRIVNAELSGRTEELTRRFEAYTAAAGKMAGIEARVFAKVFASLTPAQQARGVQGFEQAFAIMAGFFQQAAPRGGARGAGRGGGQ